METSNIVKVFSVAMLSFVLAMSGTPLLIKYLNRFKLGKRIRNDGQAPIFSELHAKKAGTPTMGGILIWLTVLVIIIVLSVLGNLMPGSFLAKLNFLSRAETLLPLGALIASALIGLVDDYLDIKGWGKKGGGGLTVSYRLLIYTLIAIVGAWWFFYKLEWGVICSSRPRAYVQMCSR